MNTITVPVIPTELQALREAGIRAALASGKFVRFHYPRPNGKSFYKDVNEFNPDDMNDLKSFRRTGGQAEYVCWTTPELRLEFITPNPEPEAKGES